MLAGTPQPDVALHAGIAQTRRLHSVTDSIGVNTRMRAARERHRRRQADTVADPVTDAGIERVDIEE